MFESHCQFKKLGHQFFFLIRLIKQIFKIAFYASNTSTIKKASKSFLMRDIFRRWTMKAAWEEILESTIFEDEPSQRCVRTVNISHDEQFNILVIAYHPLRNSRSRLWGSMDIFWTTQYSLATIACPLICAICQCFPSSVMTVPLLNPREKVADWYITVVKL